MGDPKPTITGQQGTAKPSKDADFGKDKQAYQKMPSRQLAFVGFDKEFVPERKTATPVTAETAMRWIYLSSNLRFVGVYLQGPRPSPPKKYRKETDPTFVKRNGVINDRGWMAAYAMLEQNGWGFAFVYVAPCVKLPVNKRMDQRLGRQHAQHAKSLLATLKDNLNLDASGAVVYVDNEDVQGTQVYSPKRKLKAVDVAKYLNYFRGFADELMSVDGQGRAYRFGLYAHPATIRQIAGVVPNVFAWQVIQPKRLKWNDVLTKDATDPALTIDGTTDASPRRQRADNDFRLWPVMRQFSLDMMIDPAQAAPYPFPNLDLDSSYVLDPSEPFANPRVAYIPNTTTLLRQRTFLSRYAGGVAQWQTTTQTFVKRGSVGVVTASSSIQNGAATIVIPITKPAEELHPDSPVATARDAKNRLFGGAIRRDRGVLVGELVLGQTETMELVPGSQARRPLALALLALDDTIVVVYATLRHAIQMHWKSWRNGTWNVQQAGPSAAHPLCGIAASGHPSGKKFLVATITPMRGLFTSVMAPFDTPPAITEVKIYASQQNPPELLVTSAVAAVSPRAGEHLAFAIAKDGRLVMAWLNDTTNAFGIEPSVRRLHPHSRLGTCVESEDRVHVAGIDVDGNVRRWPVQRNSSGKWMLEDSVVDGQSKATVPNPWTDIALTSTGRDQGFVAVAGIDDSTNDPENRVRAFVAPFGNTPFTPIPNA